MGRSVSTHPRAIETVYLSPDRFQDDGDFTFYDFLDDLRDNVLSEVSPSLSPCDRWEGNENHVIMENGHCEVSVSEYCGIIAVCLAPRTAENGFSVAWTGRLANKFSRMVQEMFRPWV